MSRRRPPVSQKRYEIEKNGFHIRNQRGRFSLERDLNKFRVKTDDDARNLAVPSRLKSKNLTAEPPVSQKRYVIEKNWFHIRNQRGRFSLERVSK